MDAPGRRSPCRGCARLLRPGDAWCPLCHEPAPDPRFRTGGPVDPAARADDAARLVDPSAQERTVPLRDRHHSRTAATEVTFGLVGRLVVTALLLVLTFCAFRFSPVLGIAMVVVALPWALRDTWRRVRVPKQRV